MEKVQVKIGVLLPMHSLNSTIQSVVSGGLSAIRMAVTEINQQDIIPGAYVTLIEKDDQSMGLTQSSNKTTISQAVFPIVSLAQNGAVAVIGDIANSYTTLSSIMTSTLQLPQCSFASTAASLADKSQYDYFFRTVPTELLYLDTVISFILSQNWSTLGILYTESDLGRSLTQGLISKKTGITVKARQSIANDSSSSSSSIHHSIDALMSLGARVVFIADNTSVSLAALFVAAQTNHLNSETVWLLMGDQHVAADLYHLLDRFNDIIGQRQMNKQQPANVDHAVEALAWSTESVEYLAFDTLFAGGVFIFEQQTQLIGYPPYDQFQQRLNEFNISSGSHPIDYHSGLAYSCMMAMAHGFGQIVRDSEDRNNTLQQLSSGKLLSQYDLSVFNDTGFVGPQGPVLFDDNGDTKTGNFKLYNLQNGTQVEIGQTVGGTFTLHSSPIYFDGTTTPPVGKPAVAVIKAGISSPIGIGTCSVACVGIIMTLIMLIVLVAYRKHTVFRSASPWFCFLELLGMMFCYISSLHFFISSYSKFTCFTLPITFYLGLSLILCTTIPRNYCVYKIVNNVYAAKHTDTAASTKSQLRLSAGILFINMLSLVLWLTLSANVQMVQISMSPIVAIDSCSYEGKGHMAFVTLLASVVGIQLGFSVFFTLKTKSFGGYSKYSEHKQLGLSVYNVFFSTLIGFVIFFMPTTDFYTRYYLTAMTIIWATTFSMCVLFLPKLLKIIRKKNKSSNSSDSKTVSLDSYSDRTKQLLTMSRMLDSDMSFTSVSSDDNTLVKEEENDGDDANLLLQSFKANLPVQRVFCYLPWLARWQMQTIVIFPQLGFLSLSTIAVKDSQQRQQGDEGLSFFIYSRASSISEFPGNYVFKIHGGGYFHLYVQVSSQSELYQWLNLINRKEEGSPVSLEKCSTETARTSSAEEEKEGDYYTIV